MARRRHKSEIRNNRREAHVERVIDDHGGRTRDVRWFRQDEPHELVFSLDSKIGTLTSTRRSQDLYNACLYDDAELGALIQGMQAQGEYTPQTMATNVVKRQIDTYVERQEKNQPVPMALSVDGTYEEQERAKDLSKLFAGLLDEVEYFPTLTMRRRDRAIFGNGLAQNYRIGRKLIHERVFPWELRVDPREAQYGKPRTLIRRRWIDRLVLAERFPDKAKEILGDEYEPADNVFAYAKDDTADDVFVIEIWHLPNGEPTDKDPKDGAHCICISSATLSNRVYKRDYFPFSNTAFSEPVAGFWGEGMASQLRGLQFEVNSIGLRLQENAWMTGTYVWTPPGVGLEVEHIDNGTLTHIQSDKAPVFQQPAPWHPSFFDYYMFLRGRAPAEETRQSEMGTRGELPPGLESGKAIRSWNQLDDQAYLSHGKKDERDSINTCWQLFDLCEEIHEERELARKGESDDEDAEPFVIHSEQQSYGRTIIEKLEYGRVRMDRKAFKLRVYPTSLISGTPAEQYQTAKEMAGDGLISRDAVMDLLRLPDVERVLRLETAPRRAVERILSKILRAKDPASVYVYPEPAFNLELCRALALMTYLDALTNDAPENNLRWVLQFALDAEEQLERAELEAAGGAPLGDEMAPEGEPMPDEAGGMPVDPAAMGADPALFAEPQGQILPEGAVAPEAVPSLPQM
ncbi:MAG TPA: hypothetical protein VFN70_18210 [Burkholderiales bacterium]|nr:hypothetical protein [Burkholderiales bacterium]